MAPTIQSAEPVRSGDVVAHFASGTVPVMLAHQGGWDEILLIGGPIVIIAALLMLAKKRVDAAAERPTDPD